MKAKIFDMKEIQGLSGNIKSEALAYSLVLEDQGRKTSEIADSIIPTTDMYRNAASPSPRRRLENRVNAQQGENAGANQASGSGRAQGENAGDSQPSGLDSSRGENAGTCHLSTPKTDAGNAAPLIDERVENDSEPEEEGASAEEVAKRIEKIMRFVSNVYGTDDSKSSRRMKALRSSTLGNWSEHGQVRYL